MKSFGVAYDVFYGPFFKLEQESRRAYGTAVSGVVIHLNKIHLRV